MSDDRLAQFERTPWDVQLFLELQDTLRKGTDKLGMARLLELRGPHETDTGKAADLWCTAGEARLAGGDVERADEDLRRALALNPGSSKAAQLVVARLVGAGRFAEAADVLEAELRTLDGRTDRVEHRAKRHRELGRLWHEQLGRVDRALHHWRKAWKLEPSSASIEAARAIHASLGDDEMVVKLYTDELRWLGETGNDDRRAKLEHDLGVLHARCGAPDVAARHLEKALALRPDAQKKEQLAEVYAQTGQPRAVELYLELARMRRGEKDSEGAVTFLRRALGVDPRSAPVLQALEDALAFLGRWREVERLLLSRGLMKERAQVLLDKVGDREESKRALAELGPVGRDRLRDLYREDGDWAKLVDLMEQGLDALPAERQVDELLSLATMAREHLQDRDRAADYLHRILLAVPSHAEALARYSEHFRDKRDWRGLADLAEFAVDASRTAGAPAAEITRRLEDLAQTSELRLGDVERAIHAWKRVAQVEPDNGKAREAIRRLESRAKMWESLIAVLEKEATAATGPREKAEALKRIAQVYRERQVDPRRAIALYVQALDLAPDDVVTLKALADLYEREGDDAGVARVLRAQIELRADTDRDKPAKLAELPTAQRIERLTTLRRLANMYESRLGDLEGVVYACTAILELLPGDRDAMERLERVLEKAGDVHRLEQTLTYRAEAASGPADRGKSLRKLAKLAEARGETLPALERWEAVLKAAPNDPEALAALSRLYEEMKRWGELALVLERLVLVVRPDPKGPPPDPVARAAELRRYARVVDEKLNDGARAVKAWQKVLEAMPRDRDALVALATRYEAQGNWRDLSDVLGRQVALTLVDEKEKAAEIALRRAKLLEERLGAPKDATQALEGLIRDVDPANLEAHRRLRRLYETRADFELAVRVAERELWLSEDPATKTARGLEIGALCRDRLGDPRRALQAYERVLELAPGHGDALAAAAELYAKVGEWPRHVAALEQLARQAGEPAAQQPMYLKIARSVEERIHDPHQAFEWYRKAHRLLPGAATLDEIRRAAERHDLWGSLSEVFEEERRAAREAHDARRFVALSRELAGICERRLGDTARTLSVLRDAVETAPDDETLLAEAERVAGDHDQAASWEAVLGILGIALEPLRDSAARVAMHERRARVIDERLGNPAGAMDELLRAFALKPQAGARDAILPLAERTGRWEDAITVETTLYNRETTAEGKVAAACRAAALIEERLDQPVRAFRTYLKAFRLLRPEAIDGESDVTPHLWRLARRIDAYREEDQVVDAAPAPAPAPAAAPPPTPLAPLVVEATVPEKPRADATIPLSLEDLMPASAPRADQTIELKAEDLLSAVSGVMPGATPPPLTNAPPPLPPTFLGLSVPPPRKPMAPPPALPGVHARPVPRSKPQLKRFKSAWEELAWAYESMTPPGADPAARTRALFRAAEVWERGAEDLDKAFDTLSRALAGAPGDPEPKERLFRLAADHDAWDQLAGLFISAADRAGKGDEVAKLLHEVATIRARQGKPREAETLYRRILGMRPDDVEARRQLEEVFRADERWVDLAASLEERSDPRLGTAAPEAERPAILRELAEIYDQKLGKPYEAIGALERLHVLVADDADALEQVARVYTKVGRWAKVVEALARVAELLEATTGAREARRRVARIYEMELELPERAVEAYEALVAAWPDDADAWAALDRLLEQAARWQDLAEVLRRRAALAAGTVERAALLRRRARVLLEWLGRADEAVACLRHARALAPHDGAIAEDMIVSLSAAGGAREAAQVLEERIGEVAKQGAPGDVAALLLRLAAIRADALDDREGARKALERVLVVVPDHPSALAALARLARGTDARAYAEARLREAQAVVDVAVKLAGYLDAGATLRDRVGDDAAARAAYQSALELDPANAEATWALASLVADRGDVEAAVALLERGLADGVELSADAKAKILTELAALAQRAGVPAAAERRLEEALSAKPDYLPAVIARADLYHAEAAHEELALFLRDSLPRLGGLPGHVLAELNRRLAAAWEKLGKDDDAYQVLLEADKLLRNDLRTKLALGENRYRARRWREAALHLAGLADHADAPSRAAEVAEGLYHAALAEIRALRSDRAPALYEAALRLAPEYAPALHALAEIEMERGDVARAADLLEKQASATKDDGERLRLYEALGDLALAALDDPKRARGCFEAAVAAASPLESKHVPLLRKLLVQLRAEGDLTGVGRTFELLSSFSAAGATRARELLEAAEAYLAAGDTPRARATVARAVDAEPFDEDALWTASRLDLEAGDHEAIASKLGRAMHVMPAPAEHGGPRRAELWRRLGDARRARGDVRNAQAAHEKAVAIAPESDAGLAARRAIVELGVPPDAAVAHLRALVAIEQRPAEVLALARALAAETGAGPVDEDGARATLELAAALGETLGADDQKYLDAHPARTMASDEAYAGQLDEDDRAALFGDPDDAPLDGVLDALAEIAPMLWPEPGRAVAGGDAALAADRVGPREESAALAVFSQVAKTLGMPATVLYAARAPAVDAPVDAAAPPEMTLIAAAPPAIVLGPGLVGIAHRALSSSMVEPLADAALRFRLARIALGAFPARMPALGTSAARFSIFCAGLARAFGATRMPAGLSAADVDAEGERLRTVIPFKVRNRIEALLKGVTPEKLSAHLDAARYRAACERAADRAGLLMCGNVTVALKIVGGAAAGRHLVRMAATERYLECRAKIGIGASR